MDINEMLNIDLIDVNLRAETKEELFELVGKDLEVKGFVNKNYIEGIKKREKEFPTGLITTCIPELCNDNHSKNRCNAWYIAVFL